MSTRIRINPAQLRELAQEMRAANNRNMDSIRSKISERENVNEHLASSKERRQSMLLDSMFLRVDNAGLSTLLTSFTDSYNRVESTRRPLDQIVNNETPPPSQVFESNNDTRWFVGGSRWGSIGRISQQALNNEYQAVRSMVESLRDSFGTHQSTLEGFARGGATHWYHTSSNGFASNAFISRLNYVSDDALEVFVGIDRRSGQSDGMVASVREVLDVLLRNIDITDAKGEELATQAESLASSRETTDRQARSLFEDGGLTVIDSQITRSQVELVIYLSDLLSDGKGLETAREQQHEERFNTLKTNLTSNLIEVAEFIAPSWSNIISLSCEDAITAINHWENFINQSVEVQMREAHTEQRMVRTGMDSFETQEVTVMRWGERQPRGTLRDFLGDVVTTVEALKGVLSEWQSAFTTTENRARDFVAAINSDAHISGLDEQVERAIYPSSPPFQALQSFATDAKSGLEQQANVYSNIANIIMSNMDGVASRSYVGALHRGATYFKAIAQTIEKNFWGGNFSGEGNRVSSFETRTDSFSFRLNLRRAIEEGKVTVTYVDGQRFYTFNEPMYWWNYGHTFSGYMTFTEIDGQLFKFIRRTDVDVNAVAIPFGMFYPDPFEQLFNGGWSPDEPFHFFHLHSEQYPPVGFTGEIPEGVLSRMNEMREIAVHFADRENSIELSRLILLYFGRETPEVTNLDELAGLWSGTAGFHNFVGEVQAHAELLVNETSLARTIRWLLVDAPFINNRTNPAYFEAVGIADLAVGDTGLDKTIMDLFWGFEGIYSDLTIAEKLDMGIWETTREIGRGIGRSIQPFIAPPSPIWTPINLFN